MGRRIPKQRGEEMKVNGYWLGGAIIMLSTLILHTISADILNLFCFILFMGLAFPKEKE